ncbi:MAG: hypothetical protein JEZ06_09595 [Anaerolineaceae bacterium]|nr:hypothetical protein [Anaerolineaceae bacterium]
MIIITIIGYFQHIERIILTDVIMGITVSAVWILENEWIFLLGGSIIVVINLYYLVSLLKRVPKIEE